jgi:MerR family transcriptional regulator, light-induced transcriptional regulator
MNGSPDAPVYNLKAVVRETGLKPDTIRAWERRYGLPEPQRAESGHRLYSHNDIVMLKWLVARQNEGMSISRAIVLWRQLTESNVDPTTVNQSLVIGPTVGADQPVATVDHLGELREAWLNACLNFDEQTAERVVAQAFALFPVEVVCAELLQRGLATIGQAWFEGRVTVQQEHFASALATRRIEAVLAATPPPTRPGRIVMGCPPEETHIFAPLMLTLLLRRRGWEVIFLGADVPLANLIATTRAARTQLVILVAQQLLTAATLYEMGRLLLQERVPLAFGGRIFSEIPELRQRIPGHYLGDQLGGAAQLVENIMALPRIQPAPQPVPLEYEQTLQRFTEHYAQIEAAVAQELAGSGVKTEQMERASQNLGRNIAAALALGSLDHLRPQLEWMQGHLGGHAQIPGDFLPTYLAAYRDAVAQQLDGRGELIVAWLNGAGFGDSEDTPSYPARSSAKPGA